MENDPVYDNIHGYISLSDVELDLANSPVFQRLRHVKQLGLASLVFPGAEHSRYAHSLGVMHIVEKLTDVLKPGAPGSAISTHEYQLQELRIELKTG